jgi:hypothetical protein
VTARSGLATVRLASSRNVNRSRFSPQVRLPPLLTMAGKTVGSVAAVVQPSGFAGGAGAAAQAVGSTLPEGVADGVADAPPPQPVTTSAAARKRAACLAIARRRGTSVDIDESVAGDPVPRFRARPGAPAAGG